MANSRREFLKAGACLSIYGGLTRPIEARADWFRDPELGTIPMIQTPGPSQEAHFNIHHALNRRQTYRVSDFDGHQYSCSVHDQYVHPSMPGLALDHVQVRGLSSNGRYHLEVIESATGETLDTREFRTASEKKSALRFAMISCCADKFMREQGSMWRAVKAAAPEVIFFVGDAVYADSRSSAPEESKIWSRFIETWSRLDLYRWKQLVPVAAVWDDHDYGINNGDHSFKLKDATKKMFEACYAASQSASIVEHGPGLASKVQLSGQSFYLLDDRYFRRRDHRATHWGEEQEEWLLHNVRSSRTPAWLLNGSQFFGGYHPYESVERHHDKQLERVLSELSRIDAPVVFGSGDVHYSEIMQIEKRKLGYETFELTSSSLHSFTSSKNEDLKNNHRRMEATAAYNFLLVESRVSRQGGLDISVSSIGAHSRIQFKRSLEISRERG